MLNKLIRFGKGLSLEEIQQLAPISDRYIIPHNKSLSKPHGLVLYTIKDRQGAQEEALTIMKAFQQLGLSVGASCWEDFDDMKECFGNKLEEISKDCCFLMVSIMAHGFKGHIKGHEGKSGQLNDLLKEVELRLPSFIPVVGYMDTSNCIRCFVIDIIMYVMPMQQAYA